MSVRLERRPEGAVTLSGELDLAATDALAAAFPGDAAAGAVVLEMSELDVLEGPPVAAFVSLLRELARHATRLTLVAAPQLLAHNLYRVGALQGRWAIVLVDPREEEPYG